MILSYSLMIWGLEMLNQRPAIKTSLRNLMLHVMGPTRDQIKWHIIGDSHVSCFEHAFQRGYIKQRCRFTAVGGATAVGLRNPNSMTNAFEIFRSVLVPVNRGVIPVIQMGEVDCGFVIWWRAEHRGETVENQIEASTAAYFAFVDTLLGEGYPTIVITGATMPTIIDGQSWGNVANARREVRATLADRIALTRSYNTKLSNGATARNLPFIDIAAEVIDPLTSSVAPQFRHPDRNDHHLNPQTAGKLWANALNAIELAPFKALLFGTIEPLPVLSHR